VKHAAGERAAAKASARRQDKTVLTPTSPIAKSPPEVGSRRMLALARARDARPGAGDIGVGWLFERNGN
jgi:hypothetical protein